MCRRGGIVSLVFAMTLVLSLGTAWGRLIESWPYGKLFKTAELVIIAKAESVRDAPEADKVSLPVEHRNIMTGVVTRFRVIYVVKGEHKDQRLDLVHFKMRGDWKIANGPLLVKFVLRKPDAPELDHSSPDYLLFLKKGKDGRFECVSGQYDPALSVKLVSSDPVSLSK